MRTSDRPFYVLSTGRAGSKFLSNCLSSTGVFKHDLHQQPYSRKINILANGAITSSSKQAKLLDRYISLFEGEEPEASADPLQSMVLYFYLSTKQLDNPVVHLVRDPRDMIQSFMNWKNRKLSGKVAHHIVPNWMPTPVKTGEMSLLEYATLPKYAHFAWIWNYKNRLFSSLKDSRNYQLFRMEDVHSSMESMNGLLNHIGVTATIEPEMHGSKANQSTTKTFPKWQEWSPKMAQLVHRLCGEQMLELGYGSEPEWQEKLKG